MNGNKADYITYRIKRAEETLIDAKIMLDNDRLFSCVNRSYYACFYIVSALLLQQDLTSSKHTGIRAMFNKHYVKTGIVSTDLAALYNDLFRRRHKGDYADMVAFDHDEVAHWLAQAEHFVKQIKALIEDHSSSTED